MIERSFWLAALASLGALCLVASNTAQAQRADAVNRQVLRVCSDPANLPFSNDKNEGFENKIADIIGSELGIPVEYTFFPQAIGFIRQTLAAKRCDLVIGWGQGDELVLNTNALYKSVYALIYKPGKGLDGVESLFDPRLQGKKVGVVAGLPPADLVNRAGLMANAKPYQREVDRRYFSPAEEMMKDLRSGDIDVGIQWGPIAGYFAARGGEKLTVVPMLKDDRVIATPGGASATPSAAGAPPAPDVKHTKLTFRITMGVRHTDDAWKRRLNEVIKKRQGDIDQVLLDYGVPLVDEDNKMITAARR